MKKVCPNEGHNLVILYNPPAYLSSDKILMNEKLGDKNRKVEDAYHEVELSISALTSTLKFIYDHLPDWIDHFFSNQDKILADDVAVYLELTNYCSSARNYLKKRLDTLSQHSEGLLSIERADAIVLYVDNLVSLIEILEDVFIVNEARAEFDLSEYALADTDEIKSVIKKMFQISNLLKVDRTGFPPFELFVQPRKSAFSLLTKRMGRGSKRLILEG